MHSGHFATPRRSVFELKHGITGFLAGIACLLVIITMLLFGPATASAFAGESDTAALLKVITSDQAGPDAVLSAARKLGQSKTASAVKPLSALLKHKNEHVRDGAMLALVRIGKPSVSALIKLLDDATEMPATIGESYTKRKYPELATSRSPLGWRQVGAGKLYAPVGLHVNRYAIRALGLIGERSSAAAIEAAEKKFGGNAWIRDECRRARIAILGDKTPVAAGMRPWMLAEIGNATAAQATAETVTRSFRKMTGGNVAKKFGAYTDFGNQAVDQVRRVDALAVIGNAQTAAPLLRLIDEGVRNDWQWIHAGVHDLVDHYHAIGCSWDGHWMAPLAAIRACGENDVKAAIPKLKKRLTDKNIMVRLCAARALAQLGDRSGLQTALDDARWMHMEFVSDYNTKGKPWLQHWVNDDQSKLPNDQAPRPPGQTWYRPNPNYQYLVAYDTLGYTGGEKAEAMLKRRAGEILELNGTDNFNEYYQTDLLWIAVALKRLGHDDLAKRSLDAAMQLFQGSRGLDNRLRHFHVAALPALAKLNEPSTLDAVGRVLAHHQTTWRPGTYDIRNLAWGVYLTLDGRRDPNKPLRCSELCWMH